MNCRNGQEAGRQKYTYGGASPKEGFDPSGFVQYVFQEALDIPLPRTVKEQAKIGTKVNRQDLEQGDIVFLKTERLNQTARHMLPFI
ncbi:NlpC/P60 family protein [Bacillus sonorensis]|nr:NlpC/P60 family protein [Bacillus sonorensis]